MIEFGLRRAQGIDGGLSASRAAYIGGCGGTSNVLAGKLYGIPVKGTHAHSWVMSFDSELESFEAYARVLPNNCVFLVDTYDTLQGVRHAIAIGQRLREQGHKLIGIRLDSGDLAYLSIAARKLLDEAGFADAVIMATNDLDEHIIENLKMQGAQIAVWGVGTKLATAYDQPALGGVYKLGALQDDSGVWQPKLKLSEQAAKTSIPGSLQVRRFANADGFVADMIYEHHLGIDSRQTIVDPKDSTRRKVLASNLESRDLLLPVLRRAADWRKRAVDSHSRPRQRPTRQAPSRHSPLHESPRISRRSRHRATRTARQAYPPFARRSEDESGSANRNRS